MFQKQKSKTGLNLSLLTCKTDQNPDIKTGPGPGFLNKTQFQEISNLYWSVAGHETELRE